MKPQPLEQACLHNNSFTKIDIADIIKAMKKVYRKIIDEKFIVPACKGGGVIKFEAWEHKHKVVKYNMAYINKLLCSYDNGRVLGYDNSHHFHHKHYWGDIIEIEDFKSYEELVLRFKNELKEFIQW